MSMTPAIAFEVLKLLNPTLECIHHPGNTGAMEIRRGMHYRVYAYPHLTYFAFEAEIVWPEGMTQYPLTSAATAESESS